jgi:hypothetical protein
VILNGPKLLLRGAKTWRSAITGRTPSATGLLAGALTAAIWPALAVVGGHLGAMALGHQLAPTAVQRAAVGLVATVGGALVMAPALTLALMWLARTSRAENDPVLSGPVALGIVWPVWTAGLVLALPPLLGLGPEPGEIAWIALGLLLAARLLTIGAVETLGIRRRWKWHFVTRAVLVFVLLFALIPLGPALLVRGMLGVSGSAVHAPPEPLELPLPPEPDW